MATVIKMPRQGQSVESCIITEIMKKGDTVTKGDILFAYETDKASFEEEAPEDGVVLETFYDEGDEVPVLVNLMVIGEEGESVEEFRQDGVVSDNDDDNADVELEVNSESKDITPIEMPPQNNVQGVFVSPRAKNQAEKMGVDISSLVGSGPHGRVIERDVILAAEDRPRMTPLAKKMVVENPDMHAVGATGLNGSVKGADLSAKNPVYGNDFDIKPVSNMRKLIAKAMHASLQNSAQLTHHLGADARNILASRKKVKAAMDNGYPTNITLNDMICFAIIKTLKKYPQLNAHFLGDSMKYFNKVHMGLAVDTDRGLMVPVIKNADDLTLQGLSNQFREIAAACRKGSVDPDMLSPEAASFTVSNLGSYGVEMFTPVINLPQVAILGVNTIVPRPKDLGDGVYGFVPFLGLSLTYDHRAIDGGEATKFVKQVAIEIENLDIQL